jgi:predicted nucleic acid-binding protein
MAGILVDTNILIYLYDRGDILKQAQAIRLFETPAFTIQALLSTQTLGEFFNATTRSRRPVLTPEEALSQLEDFAREFRVLPLTLPVVLQAARGVIQYRLAYYDAQLWAMAKLNQIPIIFTEDFSTGATIEGVTFVNPFASDFILEDWL